MTWQWIYFSSCDREDEVWDDCCDDDWEEGCDEGRNDCEDGCDDDCIVLVLVKVVKKDKMIVVRMTVKMVGWVGDG